MPRWPLVSRRAYDLAIEERDRLRSQVDRLLDDLVRLKRVEHRLPEAPRPKREQAPPPPPHVTIPPHVSRLFMGRTASRAAEDAIRLQVEEMHRRGAPWEEIQRALTIQLGEPGEEPT